MNFPTINITPRAAHQLACGDLWIFSNEVDMRTVPDQPGSWCWFACRGTIVATGYINRHSLIAGRVVAAGRCDDISGIIEQRLQNAFSRRIELSRAGSARLVFSESDFLPGLIVDWYSGIAVVQSSTAGIDCVLDTLTESMPRVYQQVFGTSLSGLVVRADAQVRRLEGIDNFSRVAFGEQDAIVNGICQEFDVHYAADFLNGQKTGFFLDQRRNRIFLGELVRENPSATMLDLCCYSGGWGLRGLAAGVRETVFVDQSPSALLLVKRGLELNSIASDKARCIESDVFDYLDAGNDSFDVVVADPPAFVKSKKDLPHARHAYEKLNRLAWRKVKQGGVLITCSCSHHIADPEFVEIVRTAVAKEKSQAHLFYRGYQAEDHPVLLSMPETSYLKCLGVRKI